MVRITEIQNSINTDFSAILNRYDAFLETSKSIVNEEVVRKSVEEIIEIIKDNDVKRIPYDSITIRVIDFNSNSEVIEGLSESFEHLLDTTESVLKDIINDLSNNKMFNGMEFSGKELKLVNNSVVAFYKLLEHTKLANLQYRSLYQKTEAELQELNDTTKKSIETYKKLKKDARELKRNYKNLNVEIISVLGIFASIIFAVFGGVSQLGQLGENLSKTDLGKLFIFIGSSSYILFSVLFIAFHTTAHLTERNMKVCCKEHECSHCIKQKYPIYFWSMLISILMIIFGTIIELC